MTIRTNTFGTEWTSSLKIEDSDGDELIFAASYANGDFDVTSTHEGAVECIELAHRISVGDMRVLYEALRCHFTGRE